MGTALFGTLDTFLKLDLSLLYFPIEIVKTVWVFRLEDKTPASEIGVPDFQSWL